jgi:ribosomal subunit interface protein
MNIQLQATNLDLTDTLRTTIHDKLDDALRALGSVPREVVHVQVEVEKTTRRHPQEREDERLYRAEANVTVPGRLIRAEGSGDDAERAVVEMKHHLSREIRSWREHLIDARRRGGREAKYTLGAEIEAEHLDRIDDADEQRYEEEIQAFAPGASETGSSQAGSSEAGSSEAKDRTETTDREDEA